jgi:hypothetical protein
MGMSDPNYKYCALAIHGNGDNNSVAIIDDRMHPVSVGGNAKLSTAQYKFNGSSIYFDGSGDYLDIPAAGISNFGTGDYTLRGFARMDTSQESGIVVQIGTWTSSVDFALETRSDRTLRFYAGNSVPIGIVSAINTVTTNSWFHFEVGRSSGTTKLFFNGASVGTPHSGSVNIPGTTNSNIRIGGWNDGTSYLTGYLAEIQIYPGICLHTSDFTPPAAPFETDAYAHKGTGLILPRHNPDFNGPGTITSYTRVQTGPSTYTRLGNCIVSLFDAKTKRIVAQTLSGSDGTYAFTGINPARSYYANAFDPTGNYDVTATSNLEVLTL